MVSGINNVRIVFGDSFNDSKTLGVSERDVENTIKGPDEVKKIPLEMGRQLVFFIKKIDNNYNLLVDTKWEGDKCIVISALKIPNNFIQEIGSKEPLIVLEKLANKIGLTIRVGQNEEKFIAGESFPIVSGGSHDIVQILNPNNHSFINSMLMRDRVEGGERYVDVQIAYCIDIVEYRKWINS